LVERKKLPIRWDRLAKMHLDEIHDFIAAESPDAAKKVKKEIVNLAKSLELFPEKYSKEEFLSQENEDFRSVTIWNYKIIYEVTNEFIIIADVFHTSRHPSKMNKD